MRLTITRRLFVGILLLSAFRFSPVSAATPDPGVSATDVVFGVVNDTSGILATACTALNNGLKAALERINSKGGVNGRAVKVIFKDDSYDAKKTVEMTKELVEKDHVFALTGYNATRSVKSAAQFLSKGDVPFLFPRSGDKFLRDHFIKYIFNLRPSYDEETQALIKAMAERKIAKIAFVFQQDSLGDEMRFGTIEALKKSGLFDPLKQRQPFVSEALLANDASNLNAVFETLDKGSPDAVMIGVNSANAGKFIRFVAEQKKKWIFLVGSMQSAIVGEVSQADGVNEIIMSQGFPSYDSGLPIAKEFLEDMKKIDATKTLGYLSFEGYMMGRTIAEALKRAGPDLTRERFVTALENGPFQIGGFETQWTATDHNSHNKVYLTHLKEKKLTPYQKP